MYRLRGITSCYREFVILSLPILCFGDVWEQTQGLAHAKEMLYFSAVFQDLSLDYVFIVVLVCFLSFETRSLYVALALLELHF